MKNSNLDLYLLAGGLGLLVLGFVLIDRSAALAVVVMVVAGTLVMAGRVAQLVDYFRSRNGRNVEDR